MHTYLGLSAVSAVEEDLLGAARLAITLAARLLDVACAHKDGALSPDIPPFPRVGIATSEQPTRRLLLSFSPVVARRDLGVTCSHRFLLASDKYCDESFTVLPVDLVACGMP